MSMLRYFLPNGGDILLNFTHTMDFFAEWKAADSENNFLYHLFWFLYRNNQFKMHNNFKQTKSKRTGQSPLKLLPATGTFGRMTGIFYVLLWWWGGGATNTETRVGTESCPWKRKFSCQDLHARPFNHKSGTLPLSYSCSQTIHWMTTAFLHLSFTQQQPLLHSLSDSTRAFAPLDINSVTVQEPWLHTPFTQQ